MGSNRSTTHLRSNIEPKCTDVETEIAVIGRVLPGYDGGLKDDGMKSEIVKPTSVDGCRRNSAVNTLQATFHCKSDSRIQAETEACPLF